MHERGAQGFWRRQIDAIKRFASSTTRLLLLISALAGGVVAVITLLPRTEPQEATFGAITVEPEVSLERYDASVESHDGADLRTTAASTTPAVIVDLLTADAIAPSPAAPPAIGKILSKADGAGGPTKTEPTNTTTPTNTTPPTNTTEPTRTTPPTSTTGPAKTTPRTSTTEPAKTTTPTSTTGPTNTTPATTTVYSQGGTTLPPRPPKIQVIHEIHPLPGAEVSEGTGVPTGEAEAVVRLLKRHSRTRPPGEENPSSGECTSPCSGDERTPPPPPCPSPCETRWFAETQGTATGLKPIVDNELAYDTPSQAAEVLAQHFANCRTKLEGSRPYAVGTMVTYNLTLDGFAGQWESVWWLLESLEHPQQLGKCWWYHVRAEQIRPAAGRRSFTGELWVPMPRQHGEYRVTLLLTDSEGTIVYQSKTSEIVH